jgi:ribosomal protein S27AE
MPQHCPFIEDCSGIVRLIPVLDLKCEVNVDDEPVMVTIVKSAIRQCDKCGRTEIDHFEQKGFTVTEFLHLSLGDIVSSPLTIADLNESVFRLTCGRCGEKHNFLESQLREYCDAFPENEETPCCGVEGWFVETDIIQRINEENTIVRREPSAEFLAEVAELNAFALGVTDASRQKLEQADLPF